MDDSELFAEVHRARAEYQRLAAIYDAELQSGHDAGHGTPECMLYLKRANLMGPEMSQALNRFHAAVAKLTQHYQGKSSAPAPDPGRGSKRHARK